MEDSATKSEIKTTFPITYNEFKETQFKNTTQNHDLRYGYYPSHYALSTYLPIYLLKPQNQSVKPQNHHSARMSLILSDLEHGYLDPSEYLCPVFQQWPRNDTEEAKQPRPYFHQHLLYSNFIADRGSGERLKLIGKLSDVVTGQILKYLDYRFVMVRLRYVNKSFIIFTNEYLHYMQGIDKTAVMKVSLQETYSGLYRIPPVNHPYYKYCTKLTLITQVRECDTLNIDTDLNYDEMLFEDLFLARVNRSISSKLPENFNTDHDNKGLFPALKKLKIVTSHSYDCNGERGYILEHYKILASTNTLKQLQMLVIKENRETINWNGLKFLNPTNFPNLTYLEIPNTVIYNSQMIK